MFTRRYWTRTVYSFGYGREERKKRGLEDKEDKEKRRADEGGGSIRKKGEDQRMRRRGLEDKEDEEERKG